MADTADNAANTVAEDSSLGALLAFLKGSRGFDFTGYKRTSLERRIRKRMDMVKIDDYDGYLDYLEANPGEYAELFNTILINVTDFFRDKPAWDHLADNVLPDLLTEIPEGQPIRVWCAACASGQEAFTTAMILADLVGEDRFRERVKIYATDADDDALNTARLSRYTSDQVKHVPPDQLERYFDRSDQGYAVRADLRRAVIFGRNDLVQDAPISRVDLLVCRNTLMYFNAETQARILGNFNFALKPSGVLFLGKSEMLITHSELFTPLSLKWRMFRKVPQSALRERRGAPAGAPGDEAASPDSYVRLRDGALDVSKVAQIVLDRSGLLVGSNQAARAQFSISQSDIGRPLQDLQVSYRPAELRSLLERAYAKLQPIKVSDVAWTDGPGEDRTFDITVTPIVGGEGAVLGASVLFDDVTPHRRTQRELEKSKRELQSAYEELQSVVEELETTNEELQSTNEELETTNEELQSTNEELETMNEELQSSNEELETMNDELRDRTGEINRVNTFLEAILASLDVAVAVLDDEQRVQIWNPAAEEMWGLRSDEVNGDHFLNLDIGLPVEELRQRIREALAGSDGRPPASLQAINRRGRRIRCEVTCSPLHSRDGSTHGAILLMAEAPPEKP